MLDTEARAVTGGRARVKRKLRCALASPTVFRFPGEQQSGTHAKPTRGNVETALRYELGK